MDDMIKMSLPLYSNKLNIKKFENLLSNNDQGYKFFWLEAIMKLIPNDNDMFTFEDIIDEMIVGAWKTVTHYHLRLGHTVNGNAENFLEHAIRLLYDCSKGELSNKIPSKDRLLYLIKKYNDKLLDDKIHLTDYVPYRLIKPFVDKEGKAFIDKKNYGRFIAYLNAFTKMDNEFFYDIIDAASPLQRRIHINEEWREFMMQNYALIMGWIRYNKAIFIQDRNPSVPGVMYKIAPEIEVKHKSLKNARELWIATVNLTGNSLYEIYTGNELDVKVFDLDHFVPRSYVSNDELWNLTPASKSLNTSKNNRLPDKRYIKEFVKYNYYLYKLIFDNDDRDMAQILMRYFEKCENQHLNAIWATERLYIPGNSQEQFGNVLEENLSLVYNSAKLQEYEMWVI
ncbi:HNH endonuclease domain-containing protein [Lacrimispora amygdalina]|uniref:HNH endonuclease domain-containing protein n=1 Tax=Lacrimispora amygdalina TaxID=253257 RepID=UPI000BE3DD23|nr:HNH endonuclease domain-containing protein [Lacrimispora amygdalina]